MLWCGDGVLIKSEECDDNNLENLDGCSKECKIEEGYECDGPICILKDEGSISSSSTSLIVLSSLGTSMLALSNF